MPQGRDAATDERLQNYRAKRDFSITSEPEGTDPPSADGWRFVVQRHRATRLHYDLRLEAAGVLLSWAVPKSPTLDPDVRRMAVHVEDHPLDYFDFEGAIPAGEYGGGDVIVWDWGSWALAKGDDPLQAVAAGDLHFAVLGEKLRGRFALVRRDRRRDEWLLIKKHDDDAVPGWAPEEHPRSVKSGRTNDEVRDAPAASWTGSTNWAGPTDDELAALDELGTRGTWTLGGTELRLTNLDKVVFAGRDGDTPLTKRDLIRHHATMAPAMLPYLSDRPVNLHRRPSHTPAWIRRWRDADATAGEPKEYIVPDSAAALAWLANAGTVELHPSMSTIDEPRRPTWALFDVDASSSDDVAGVVELARLHRIALDHLGIEGRPTLTGRQGIQIWVPVARRYTFDQTRHWVETVARAIRATVPDLAGVASEERAGRATLVAPFSARPAPGAPVSVPLSWDELDDDDLRLDRWTIRDIGERLARAGDPLAPLIGRQQRLPSL